MTRERLILTFIALSILLSNLFASEHYDPKHIPFSHFGAYMSLMVKVDPETKDEALFIRDISGRRLWHWKGVFRVDLIKEGKSLPYNVEQSPTLLIAKSDEGQIQFAFDGEKTLRIYGEGVGLRLTQKVKDWSSVSFPASADSSIWRCQMGGYDHFVFTCLKGKVIGDPAKSVAGAPLPKRPQLILDISPDSEGVFEASLEQYHDAWKYKETTKTFQQCVEESQESIETFNQNQVLPTSPDLKELNDLTTYIKWHSVVHPKGFMKRYAFYCSKNHMNAVWTWDNCFSAMATCYNDLDWALDQILVMFDSQTDKGVIPDHLTDEHPMWGMHKPPIQGLAMMKMMQLSKQKFEKRHYEKVYSKIKRHTNFWFEYMDDDGNGIPQYNHANDSGEDNGTVYEIGYPAEGPDLCSYLILQMEFLEKAATELGIHKEAKMWKQRSKVLLKLLIKELWTGEGFVTRNAFTREYNKKSHAYINYTPIILGDRLPKKIRTKLIYDLKDPKGLVTPYGPASEHPDSPYFNEDGYWRGAIWAPQWYFLVEGANKCGEQQWAKELAQTYIDLCKKNGFPENFSALDGHPLKDSGYSWTADVFILLAHEYLTN